MSERLQTALVVLALCAAGAFAWSLELRPALRVDAGPLAALPRRIDVWEGHDLPLEEMVERMLRADFNLQREYVHPLGEPVWLYVGYYGTDRGGRPEHTPDACYPSHGWAILRRTVVDVDPATGLRANEYLVEQAGARHLVLFWYRSRRSTGLLGGLGQAIDRGVSRIADGRGDGALVRISTPVAGEGETAARARLVAFATVLDGLLAAHWPVERTGPADAAAAAGGGGAAGGGEAG